MMKSMRKGKKAGLYDALTQTPRPHDTLALTYLFLTTTTLLPSALLFPVLSGQHCSSERDALQSTEHPLHISCSQHLTWAEWWHCLPSRVAAVTR